MKALDNPATRARVAKSIYRMSRAGFLAAGAANRPFKAMQKLLKPVRAAKSGPPDLFDLTPTDEQAMIADAMKRFAAEVMRPAAAAADEAGAAPAAFLSQAAELGLAAMSTPEGLGGAGSEHAAVTNALVAEALGHGDMGLAVACLSTPSVACALASYGDASQQATYVPSLAGDKPPHAAIALMEPQTLFNPFRLATAADTSRDGYILDGEKVLVAGAMGAELFLVAAQLDRKPAMFVVESGTRGLSVAPQPAMGLRAASLGRVKLKRARLPKSALLGGKEGFDYGEFIARARLAWCALAVGAGQAVLDYVIPYANDRVAFGEPISHRQGVAFMIANIGIELEGMRLATRRAASRAAAGQPFARHAALARSLCSRHGMKIGSDGVQVLGGHGYVKEHPVERWYRDLRAVGVMEGSLLV